MPAIDTIHPSKAPYVQIHLIDLVWSGGYVGTEISCSWPKTIHILEPRPAGPIIGYSHMMVGSASGE